MKMSRLAIATVAAILLGAVPAVLPFSSIMLAVAVSRGPAGSCGNVLLAGSAWLGGQGVNVKSNGYHQGSGVSCGGTNHVHGVTTGSEWQCTELVNRLYVTRGWITGPQG